MNDPKGPGLRALLALFLALLLFPVLPVKAQELPFEDVSPNAWYAADVERAYESGLFVGVSETSFDPDGKLLLSQTVTLAARVAQTLEDGSVTLENGSPVWYSTYVDYAKRKGIIGDEYDGSWSRPATRGEMVTIFAAIPGVDVTPVNQVEDGAIPDVGMNDGHAGAVYAFYRAGILTGSDGNRFNGSSDIARREVAAILSRLLYADRRQSVTLRAADLFSRQGFPFAEEAPTDRAFALVNGNRAFLSVDEDIDTLILSDAPCLWRLAPGENGDRIQLERDHAMILDLDNAWYQAGTRVHLYWDIGGSGQFWKLTKYGDGFLITSAQKPEWCVLSRERGFILSKTDMATQNDIWKILPEAEGIESLRSNAAPPYYRPDPSLYREYSYTPTPEFWEAFEESGITQEMIDRSIHQPDYCAQYLLVYPMLSETEQRFDFFSVDFRTDSLADYTYWSLVSWWMDYDPFMQENGYTRCDTVGAYAGLQDVGEYTTGITSMWQTDVFRGNEKIETLVPTCVYPEGRSRHFDNEGSGTSLIVPLVWEAGTWYRFVLRSWQYEDTTYIGTWLENLETEEVTLIAIYDTHLPDSCLAGGMYQFLEDYGWETYGEYRQMQLRNYCLRGADTQQWYFPDGASMSIWTDLGYNQGTYRYSASDGVFTGETCGLGENVCEGVTEEETIRVFAATPAAEAPDPQRYAIPEEFGGAADPG